MSFKAHSSERTKQFNQGSNSSQSAAGPDQ